MPLRNIHLDKGGGGVVQGGVEPLDGVDHAGMIHKTSEADLVISVFQCILIVLQDNPDLLALHHRHVLHLPLYPRAACADLCCKIVKVRPRPKS